MKKLGDSFMVFILPSLYNTNQHFNQTIAFQIFTGHDFINKEKKISRKVNTGDNTYFLIN